MQFSENQSLVWLVRLDVVLDQATEIRSGILARTQAELSVIASSLGTRPPDRVRWARRLMVSLGRLADLGAETSSWLGNLHGSLIDLGCPALDPDDWSEFVDLVEGLSRLFEVINGGFDVFRQFAPLIALVPDDEITAKVEEMESDIPQLIASYEEALGKLEEVNLEPAVTAAKDLSQLVYDDASADAEFAKATQAGWEDVRTGRTSALEEFAERHGIEEP